MVQSFYSKSKDILEGERSAVLLVVVFNEGSSPGRKGFKMLVTQNQMHGTIGGGIMEHKLAEYARSLLQGPAFTPFLKHQIHDKSAVADQSGMICSGRQSIAFYPIGSEEKELIHQIAAADRGFICYSKTGIQFRTEAGADDCYFVESVSLPLQVYIIGGGHVGLALSEILSHLDFEIHLLDHRENLNTMEANLYAHTKRTIDFEKVDQYIPEGDHVYVVIMSFGYRTDDIIIRRLLHKNFKYIGMLGSKEKIKTLFAKLAEDGFSPDRLQSVFAPIGLDIKSETAAEIAISVAAQLIQVKNKGIA